MSKNNNKDSGNESWNRVDPAGASDGDIQRVHDELVHDKETPRHGFSPIPIFLVLLISGLIVFSGIYVVWRSDDFDQLGYDESRRRFAWDAEAGPAVPRDPLVVGQRLYTQNCSACHGAEGQGVPGAFPPLDGTSWVVGSEDRLIRVVMSGLMGPIEVKGNQYNGVMPPFGHMNDDQLAAVLSYIRQAWSNEAPAVTPEQVGQVRRQVGQRGPWQAVELLQEFPD
jgi:mono/diheme cytochrome c family protein